MSAERFPAIFLDKDGTLIDDVPYNVDPALIRLAPGAAEGTALLARSGYKLVVVSNQSGVARGLFAEGALIGVEQRIRLLLAEMDVELAGFYYCPHHPQGLVSRYAIVCQCRKPAPGLLLSAARELDLDLAHSWLIGDILDDIAAGHRAGCRAVLVDNGNETQWRWSSERRPEFMAQDLAAAARTILSAANTRAMEPVA
jgi:D-glycero-D-manno-heptose 1,7-bisphosphate phosphatase